MLQWKAVVHTLPPTQQLQNKRNALDAGLEQSHFIIHKVDMYSCHLAFTKTVSPWCIL